MNNDDRTRMTNITDSFSGTRFCQWCKHRKNINYGNWKIRGHQTKMWKCSDCEKKATK